MTIYPRVSWREHLDSLRWRQGEHVMVIAPNGAGKTTIGAELAKRRSHVVMFTSKVTDETISQQFRGWRRIVKWPKGGPPPWQRRHLLWPYPGNSIRETVALQRAVFTTALDDIFVKGNRCVIIDEALMFSEAGMIGLGKELGMMHYTGRSNGISMVVLSQRPFWIPKVVMSSIAHAYIARTKDPEDIKKLRELQAVDRAELEENVRALDTKHDFVYLNPYGDAPPVIVNTRK